MTLQLPPEYSELATEREQLRERLGEVALRQRDLRKAAMEAAGWTRCCRCFPSCVSDDGFCGCCMFNHATGKRLDVDD